MFNTAMLTDSTPPPIPLKTVRATLNPNQTQTPQGKATPGRHGMPSFLKENP
ncbi:MAG: hypothetical protein ACE5Z5_01070 [Candidatus Bathyarchaeia archaeon]